MKLLDQKTKLRFLSMARQNPAMAVIYLSEALENLFNQKIAEIREEIFDHMSNLPKGTDLTSLSELLENIKGKDGENGESADPEDVARILMEDEDFIEMVRGEDGENFTPLSREEIADILKPLIPEPVPGPKGEGTTAEEVAGLLMSNKHFISLCKGEKGDSVSKSEVKALIKASIKPAKEISGSQIVDSINALPIKPSMQIGKEHIKGLDETLRVFERNIRERTKGAGGGMGNWITETFNLTTSTTTVSLGSKVSANGRAISIYYNGVYLVPGTGFTIGADRKTVTLLFTPENGTFLDTIYVRA